MEIWFATNRLGAAGRSLSEATRLFGVPISRRHLKRLGIIRATDHFRELYGHRALRLHPLRGDRSGQYGMTLSANFRLILERISEDKVRVLDVEDYHGD